MAFIDIDSSLNVAEETADLLLTFINDASEINRGLNVYEILAEKVRPGLNAEVLANSIVSRFKEIGLPSGPLVNGAQNVMEAFVIVLCEEIIDAIQNDMRVDVGIFPGGTVNANGANAGGPVAAVGATITAQDGIGIAR
jgi:hypothetical protein